MVPNLSGTHLGIYEVRQLLGKGGMARVYEGFDPHLERQVAIKVLSEATAEMAGITERFQHEARLLASLSHPHVVAVYAFGEQDGYLYIVQELLPGPTLEGWMKERADQAVIPTRPEVLQIIQHLASGLEAAHAAGIIHRDVKPANVMWNRVGVLVLTDFGIAKQPQANAGLTQAGIVMGTPAYLSPEQAQGWPLTVASDIYALGVILYELLSGHPPFQGDTPMGTVLHHIQTPPPPLEARLADVPPTVADVVERALAKDPDARFKSASALVSALAVAWPLTPASIPTEERATRAWVAPAVSPVAAQAVPAPSTRASQTAEATSSPTPPPAAPARRPLVLPPAPPRSAWSVGLPLAVGALILFAALWAIQTLDRRDDAALDTGDASAIPTAQSGVLPTTTAPALVPAADPLLEAQIFLESSLASGQLGKDGNDLLKKLAEAQKHLAEGKTGEAESKLQEMRRKLAEQGREGKIDAAVAAQAVQLLDNIAQHYGLTIEEEEKEKDKDD